MVWVAWRMWRDLHHEGRGYGEGESFHPPGRGSPSPRIVAEDELFPQPATVLASELARQGIEVSHPLDGNEEGFVG